MIEAHQREAREFGFGGAGSDDCLNVTKKTFGKARIAWRPEGRARADRRALSFADLCGVERRG